MQRLQGFDPISYYGTHHKPILVNYVTDVACLI